jgi:hypothetical protein
MFCDNTCCVNWHTAYVEDVEIDGASLFGSGFEQRIGPANADKKVVNCHLMFSHSTTQAPIANSSEDALNRRLSDAHLWRFTDACDLSSIETCKLQSETVEKSSKACYNREHCGELCIDSPGSPNWIVPELPNSRPCLN